MLDLLTPSVLILLAGGFFMLGYLIINQMLLRSMMLIGSGFYLAYYTTAAAEPLWGAIYTTLAMVGTNLIGMVALTLRQMRVSLPHRHRDIYDRFEQLPPGDFRLVMRHAERMTLDAPLTLTNEGAPVTHLYYILNGSAQVTKAGARFNLPHNTFVGEVAYLLDRASVATTELMAGSEVIRWDLDKLRRTAPRNPRFKLALDAMLSSDLAQKVSIAVAPQRAVS